jgi:H3 lysine-79-specific histone-lysine N-methyltransferase
MSLIYNRAVQEPGKLNQYEAFSPEVYGETGFDIIDQMLTRVPLSANDIFLDLGSGKRTKAFIFRTTLENIPKLNLNLLLKKKGVGNVVLHVAAVSNCKTCYGFEKAECPAKYAELMEKEFVFWMNFFGKSYSNFKIYKADFLSDEESVLVDSPPKNSTMNEYVREIINEAKLVFVNNYAFGAEVDHQLKLRFCNMTEGAFIISSKPFCPLNFRINSRNLNDIGTIINFSDFEPLSGHVSWTDKIINYYIQKIDRTLLEKYFEKRKNPLAICVGKKDDETSSSINNNQATVRSWNKLKY